MKDYKLLCYNEFVIPIPVWAEWIAWDDDGDGFLFEFEPEKVNSMFWDYTEGRVDYFTAPPPEEGDWTTQLYYLEDL